MFRKKKSPNEVVVLLDLENLTRNMDLPPAEKFSLIAGFDRVLKKIAEEVGEIVNVFVFAPPHLATLWGEELYGLGFFVILCPKIRGKTGEEKDTTDATLIEFGRKIIARQNFTHLCLCSGDKDFSPFLREAARKGLKIIIIAGNLKSLSIEVIRLADKKPSGERMVYVFSPTDEE